LLVLVLAQIYLGALVAGLRAGLVYNTWPMIDGALVPDAARLWFEQPWWRNLFENALTVQFMHRMVAYALFLFALLHAVDVMRMQDRVARLFAIKLAAAVMLQAALGIVTLLHQTPIALAIAHQAMAIVVLTLATLQAERLIPRAAAPRLVAAEQGT
jgi:heme a synthase